MAVNYAPPRPRDKQGEVMVGYPAAKLAVARYSREVLVSSVVTLTDNTTTLEVVAVGGNGIALKWIATSDTQASVIGSGATANFDHIIPAGVRREFQVPIEGQGTSSVVGLNVQLGLYRRVAWGPASTGTTTSVFSAEF